MRTPRDSSIRSAVSNVARLVGVAMLAFSLSCIINLTPDETDDDQAPDRHGVKLHLFPFENLSNWWAYSAEDGNPLAILVIDTISDAGIIYYKVSFRENRKDTTDDWFSRTDAGIEYNTKLIGDYMTFLPDSFPDTAGVFQSDSQSVGFRYRDSVVVDGKTFSRVIELSYPQTFLHGFSMITLADSVGIVALTDTSGRFPVTYSLDSCSLDSTLVRFP